MRLSRQRLLILLAATSVLTGTTAPAHAASDPTDPWEPMNRKFFAMNEAIDKHIIGPFAHGFGATPLPFRAGLINFGHNLGEPTVFVNDLLQGHVGKAAETLTRFVVNSTLGIGGLIDVAKHNHLPRHDNGFGTTMGHWGFKPGPYIFLPLVGPSTFRDSIGGLADVWVNPLTYSRYPHKAAIGIGTTIITGLGERVDADQDLETIRQTSTDPYASLRSLYLQNRQAEVTGKGVTIENLPDFDDPGAKPAPGAAAPPSPQAQPTPPPAETPKPQAAAAAPPSLCAPPAIRWADADAPYATWRGA